MLRAGRVAWLGRVGDVPLGVVEFLRDGEAARAALEAAPDAFRPHADRCAWDPPAPAASCSAIPGPARPDNPPSPCAGWAAAAGCGGACEDHPGPGAGGPDREGGPARPGGDGAGQERQAERGRGTLGAYLRLGGWAWAGGAAACLVVAQTAATAGEGAPPPCARYRCRPVRRYSS